MLSSRLVTQSFPQGMRDEPKGYCVESYEPLYKALLYQCVVVMFEMNRPFAANGRMVQNNILLEGKQRTGTSKTKRL